MKITNKLFGMVAVAATVATAQAELSIGGAEVSGYLLLGAYGNDVSGDTFDSGVQEFETAFNWELENNLSATVELSYDGTDVGFETVTITYAASDALSFTAGNILSYQGWETYDASGLYQSSYAGPFGEPLYSAGYAFGASVDYVTDDYGFGLWIGESDAGEKVSVEALAQYTGIEGLTLKAIVAEDPLYTTFNFWASYEFGDTTLAAEYVTTEYDNGFEYDAYLFMIYQAFGDAGLTLRYSAVDYAGIDGTKITVAPSYSFSDNILGLVEASYVDVDGEEEVTEFAAELLFTY